jgi:pimeloyl-ACP methyl ester carboxylesterase
MRSHTIDLDGPVHYQDGGGTGPIFVLVHGLGGSHLNWAAVAPRLAERGRVLVPDLAGHGRTPAAGRSATVMASMRLLDRFVGAFTTGPVILVGNSMGGLICLLQTAAHPERVAGLVLVDPSLPLSRGARVDVEIARSFAAYAVPGVGERYLRARRARLGAAGMVADTLRFCCVDPGRVPEEAVAAAVALQRERATVPGTEAAFLEAARSLLALHASRRSVALVRDLPAVPTLLVQGARDRLVPVASARWAARQRPDWSLEVLDDVGHVPQLEAPGEFLERVERWLDGPGRPALTAADPASVAGP